ncbi:Phage gp6-like head-tail connector protein [Sphingomonas laterariae]|uniref:Phage gp6-like head-tail connector protein n=1 Tax=Edaphosphingomonas laterariae TaxID=861865 RepID=A0A239FE35_9SPHN|nr:head-tail connector protein [Sphingomonas laterariae]SNS55196.1 Phage gp6-like head-tail connector protein [Sphingomonas laterariae]
MTTIAEMREATGLGPEVSDAAVVSAWADMIQGATPVIDEAMPLVSLEEAKLYCRVDGTYEDATLEILIEAASATVRAYAATWDGIDPVPARLKLATLALVAAHYDLRSDISDVNLERILAPYREHNV